MTRRALSAVAAALLMSLAASTTVGAAHVELVDESDEGLTLRYEPGDVLVTDAAVPGYSVVGVPGASRVGLPGSPELPVVSVRVAVPYCEAIDVTVETAGSRSIGGVRVVPSPTTVADSRGISDAEFVEGPVYSSDGLWPPRAARVFEPTRAGSQRFTVVDFYPCQTDPTDETLVTHGAVEVRLSFRGLTSTDRSRGESPRRERQLESMLLNYESGKRWRGRPASVAERRDDDYFTTSSNWVKLTVRERGMYAVSYADMASVTPDPSLVDPSTFRVFSGGGLPVPFRVTDERPDWMEECSIRVDDGGDGSFDAGDAIMFYGLGVDAWHDELGSESLSEPFYYENPYANDSVYWLTWENTGIASGFTGDPSRMDEEEPSSSPSPPSVSDYEAREHFESNVYEVQGRGDGWFWFELRKTGPEEYYFHELLDHVVTDSTGTLRGYLRGNSADSQVNPDHRAVLYLNGAEANVAEWDAYGPYLFEADELPINEGYNTYKVFAPRDNPLVEEDKFFVDWFEIIYWRELWTDSGQLPFGSSGRTGATEFSMGGFTDTDVSVFKVQDKYTVSVVPGVAVDGDRVVFQDDVADSASYIAVSASGYKSPASLESRTPGALRTPSGADYIMVAHDGFYDEAARLASLRASAAGGGFQVVLVNVSQVYDEFSWGLVDPAAIRDFLKYRYDTEPIAPTHAIFIGDASSDYRQHLPSSIQTFVPTVYTGGISNWPTEPWFVGFSGTSLYYPALALGRLPVRSVSELRDVIDKIERYETDSVPGPWKNTVIIVGDDEYKWTETDPDDCCEFFHTAQAESLHRFILPRPLERKKIYLMEYERDLAGHKTEARNDLIDAWKEGALLVNYVGHGNEQLMAHEYVFLFDDVARLTNSDALPLYFAASCRLNKFDMPTTDSLGEILVKTRGGGAIASIGSTRDSGATQNSTFNAWFIWYTFGEQNEETRAVADLGTAFQMAFVAQGTSWGNNTKFCLIGDPALKLASPEGSGSFETGGLEPLERRSTVSLAGENEGATAGESGVALLLVSDSADTSGYYHTSPGAPKLVRYSLPGEPIFDGPVEVTGGALEASFVVSALAEEGPYGRIRSYFYSDGLDGAYSVENVTIADSVDVEDAAPPDITLEFEGGGTSILPGTVLEIAIEDTSGINLVDHSGEDGIVLTVDGSSWIDDLTDEFAYDLGSHERGTIELSLPSLDSGSHTLSLSASDNMGNRGTEIIAFELVSATDFTIRDVANYPNPFPDGGDSGTHVLFQLPAAADVTIQIFTVGGRLIRVLDGLSGEPGANQVYWDGLDQQGDEPANGVYLYRIHAVSKAYRGDKAEAIGRAVIMR